MASVFVVAVGVAVAPPRASRWSPSPSSPSPLRSSSHSSLLPYRVTIASMWRRKREHSCALVRARAPRQREEKERVEAFLHSFFFLALPHSRKKNAPIAGQPHRRDDDVPSSDATRGPPPLVVVTCASHRAPLPRAAARAARAEGSGGSSERNQPSIINNNSAVVTIARPRA